MRKENTSYELIIDLITSIVKKYIDNASTSTNELNKVNKEEELVCTR